MNLLIFVLLSELWRDQELRSSMLGLPVTRWDNRLTDSTCRSTRAPSGSPRGRPWRRCACARAACGSSTSRASGGTSRRSRGPFRRCWVRARSYCRAVFASDVCAHMRAAPAPHARAVCVCVRCVCTLALCLRQMCVHTCAPRPHTAYARDDWLVEPAIGEELAAALPAGPRLVHDVRLRTVCGISARAVLLLLLLMRACALALCRRVGTRCRRRAQRTLPRRSWV